MINISEEKQCCGCGACSAACPVDCIQMKPGTLGAVFPQVDFQKCIQCGNCRQVCPMTHTTDGQQSRQLYAAYAKDPLTRFSGSSGGIFGVLAKMAISKGCKVYGAAFDEKGKLRCMSAESEEELKPLLKSKYLQSDMTSQYSCIRADLNRGQTVLFVSSPCQVSALKLFLGKPYDNLILVDFLCHGVPSQQLFDQCMAYEEWRHNCKILDYSFRTKLPNGATPHYFTVKVEKKAKVKEITRPYYRSVFYTLFQQYICLRESCYDCVFDSSSRVSDLTIGDFHKIEKYIPTINRFDGVSTVLINTEKGRHCFFEIQDKLWFQELPLERLIKAGDLFAEKTKRPSGRDAFIESYETKCFDDFVRDNIPVIKYMAFDLYYRLPPDIRSRIKKFCGKE